MYSFDLNYINELEDEFASNSFNGRSEKAVQVIGGNIPILLSAPHSVNQIRNEKVKLAERYTGAISKALSKETGAHVIYKSHNDGTDDNHCMHTEYKDTIGKIIMENDIKFVLDIHGMLNPWSSLSREYHIEIGTNHGKNLLHSESILPYILDAFDQYGIKDVVVDRFFKASKSYTISNYVAVNYSTPAVQIEISSAYRNPNFSLMNFNKTVSALSKVINEVNKSVH